MTHASPELNTDYLTLAQRRVLLALALLITAGVFLQGQVPLSPRIYFDVDPRSDAGRQPITSLGPMGAGVLHLALTTLSLIALAVWSAFGMKVSRWALGLATVGGVFALLHATHGLDSRIHAAAWISAAAGGVAVYHLAQDAAIRRWLAAAAVGLLVMWGLDAVWYVWQEHPMTVRMFMAHEDEFLSARGWVRDSAQHDLYVRRLSTPDVIGSFGLSNVFGSLLAAFTLLAGVLTLLALKAKHWQRLAIAAIPSAFGLTALLLTRSKGAALGLVAGAVFLVAVMLVRKFPRGKLGLKYRGWALIAFGVLLIAGALGAVWVRGMLGPPETWAGERSLLFRWHYLLAGARIWTGSLASMLAGVGPEGFRAGYHWAKVPINPEEVTSTHSVFADYIVMLGVGGLCWTALLLAWWLRAARAVGAADETAVEPEGEQPLVPKDKARAWASLAFALVAMLPALLIQHALLTPEALLLWAVGVAAMMMAVAVLGRSAGSAAEGVKAGLLCAGLVLLIHNQIEMAFFQPASAALAWWVLGLCGACGVRPSVTTERGRDGATKTRLRLLTKALFLFIIVGVLAAVITLPVWRYERSLHRAATQLRAGDVAATEVALIDASAAIPQAKAPRRWRVGLLLDAAYAHGRAGDAATVKELLDRAERAAPAQPPPRDRAWAFGHESWQHAPWLLQLKSEILLARARLTDQPELRQEAAEALHHAVDQTPYSLTSALRLARMQDQLGRSAAALGWYERALQISEWNYLDPAKQLTDTEREAIEQRVRELKAAGPSP